LVYRDEGAVNAVGTVWGVVIAALLSLLVVLHAGMALFWDIMLPGMVIGLIVGFATQRFGRKTESKLATQ